jgi:hypothetical protein
VEDQSVLARINELVAEEHKLLAAAEANPLETVDHQRLQSIQVTLDQCWDYLRQRRARREFGRNPDTAHPRDPSTVEEYQQ